MTLWVKHQYWVYRRFEQDIWGLCFLEHGCKNESDDESDESMFDDSETYFIKSWLIRFFHKLYIIRTERWLKRFRRYIYRIDVIESIIKRRKYKYRFISLRIARLYFITLKDNHFRILFRKASKLDGNLENNYCFLLECRLMALFYRTNFLPNIFEIIRFIKRNNVLINFKCISFVNANVPQGAYITFARRNFNWIKRNLFLRAIRGTFLFGPPRFLFVSFRFFFAFLCKLPFRKDFVYPIALDIARITGYD